MARTPALIPTKDAKSLLSAARSAGWPRATLLKHPDGRFEMRCEIIGEDDTDSKVEVAASPFAKWKAENEA